MADETPPGGELRIYEDGASRLQVRNEGSTVWLSQRLIAEMYEISVKTLNEHLINICAGGELDREPTIRNFRIVQREDKQRTFFSLQGFLHDGTRNWNSPPSLESPARTLVLGDGAFKVRV